METLKQIIEGAGFFELGVIDTASLKFSHEVRGMCEVDSCHKYGKTWACPPGVGTVEECEARIKKYPKMIVFSGKYELEDSFDFEGMVESAKRFSDSCKKLDGTLEGKLDDYMMFVNGGCDRCEKCTYPKAPCRFPDKVHGSLESNGLFVSKIAKRANIKYNNGQNTVTYFGAFVCNEEELEKLK